jgi:hypothetical protein
MSDYASIMGGAPETIIGQTVDLDDVARNWDAYYYIESDNVFLDRYGATGDSIVDANATDPATTPSSAAPVPTP